MKVAFPIESATLPSGLETFDTDFGKGVRTKFDANTLFHLQADDITEQPNTGNGVIARPGPSFVGHMGDDAILNIIAGKYGNAFDFTGTAGQFHLFFSSTGKDRWGTSNGVSSLVRQSGESLTVECWVKVDALTGFRELVALGKADEPTTTIVNWCLGLNAQQIRFYFRNSANSAFHVWTTTSNVITSTSTWYHVAVVFTFGTAASIKIFVDGVSVAGSWTTGDGTAAPYTGATDWTLGLGQFVGATVLNPLDGKIEDLRISSSLRYSGDFTPPAAQLTPYTTGGLTIDDSVLEVDLGEGKTGDFDPTTFACPIWVDGAVAAESSTTVEFQYSTDGGTTYNGSWLTVDGIQAVSAATFADIRRLRIKIRVTTNGDQFIRIMGVPTITLSGLAGSDLIELQPGYYRVQGGTKRY